MKSSSADIDGESKASTAFEGIDAVASRASINLETSESDASRVEIQQPASNSRFAEKNKIGTGCANHVLCWVLFIAMGMV